MSKTSASGQAGKGRQKMCTQLPTEYEKYEISRLPTHWYGRKSIGEWIATGFADVTRWVVCVTFQAEVCCGYKKVGCGYTTLLGGMPYFSLNTVEKYFSLPKPTSEATSLMLPSLFFNMA